MLFHLSLSLPGFPRTSNPQHFNPLLSFSLSLRESGGDFLQTWYTPVRREFVQKLRQVLRELCQKILFADAGLLCNIANGLLPKRRAQLPGFDRLVLTGSDPGFDDLAVARTLQLLKETTKAANKAAILGWGTCTATLRCLRLACRAATGQHPAHKKCTESKQERF
jgi:hypothetical protein